RPAFLAVLASALCETDVPAAAELLRQAQQRHPGDFGINLGLAQCLMSMKPPQLDEAIGFYRAAVALRPEGPGAHQKLAEALRQKGRGDEARSEERAAFPFKRGFPDHGTFGAILRTSGRLDEAAIASGDALRRFPDRRNGHLILGHALLKG